MKVFVSYARLNKETAESLVRDLHALGHQAFYDRDLTGGQRWWDTLLDQIVNSDVFVPVLSDEYRESEACRAEAKWAEALEVPFLPITVVPQLPGMYDPRIAESNWVSYDPTDRNALADLSRAVAATQTTVRPQPLPAPPPIPLSYLVLVEREIRTSEDIGRHRQLAIVSNLRSKLGGREASGARELLAALRERPDVTHEVATTIDSLLTGHADETALPSELSDIVAANQPVQATGSDPASVQTQAREGEYGVADAGSAADVARTDVDKDEQDQAEERPPAPAMTPSDRGQPSPEVHHASPLLIDPSPRSRQVRGGLVVLGGCLIFLSVSVVPWLTVSRESGNPRVWVTSTELLTKISYGGPTEMGRWFITALAYVLLAGVITVAALTQVGHVATPVRAIAMGISALLAVGGVVVTIRDDFFPSNEETRGGGPYMLFLGLVLLTVVLARPAVASHPDAAQPNKNA